MSLPAVTPVAKMNAIALIKSSMNSPQLILSVLAVGIVFFSLKLLKRRTQLSNIPAVGRAAGNRARREEFLSGKARDLYVEGYKKVGSPSEDSFWQN